VLHTGANGLGRMALRVSGWTAAGQAAARFLPRPASTFGRRERNPIQDGWRQKRMRDRGYGSRWQQSASLAAPYWTRPMSGHERRPPAATLGMPGEQGPRARRRHAKCLCGRSFPRNAASPVRVQAAIPRGHSCGWAEAGRSPCNTTGLRTRANTSRLEAWQCRGATSPPWGHGRWAGSRVLSMSANGTPGAAAEQDRMPVSGSGSIPDLSGGPARGLIRRKPHVGRRRLTRRPR
jgi:hypothetical protein